jgi:hypothetical protein
VGCSSSSLLDLGPLPRQTGNEDGFESVTRRTTTGGSLLATKSVILIPDKNQNQMKTIDELFAAGYESIKFGVRSLPLAFLKSFFTCGKPAALSML